MSKLPSRAVVVDLYCCLESFERYNRRLCPRLLNFFSAQQFFLLSSCVAHAILIDRIEVLIVISYCVLNFAAESSSGRRAHFTFLNASVFVPVADPHAESSFVSHSYDWCSSE
jgi:hypothetical protein